MWRWQCYLSEYLPNGFLNSSVERSNLLHHNTTCIPSRSSFLDVMWSEVQWMEKMIYLLATSLITMDEVISSVKDLLSTLHLQFDDSIKLKWNKFISASGLWMCNNDSATAATDVVSRWCCGRLNRIHQHLRKRFSRTHTSIPEIVPGEAVETKISHDHGVWSNVQGGLSWKRADGLGQR